MPSKFQFAYKLLYVFGMSTDGNIPHKQTPEISPPCQQTEYSIF